MAIGFTTERASRNCSKECLGHHVCGHPRVVSKRGSKDSVDPGLAVGGEYRVGFQDVSGDYTGQ